MAYGMWHVVRQGIGKAGLKNRYSGESVSRIRLKGFCQSVPVAVKRSFIIETGE